MSEVLVTLAEVTTATGRKADQVRAECNELGMSVRDDWAGRPSITVQDARGLVSGSVRREQEGNAAWAAHLAEVKAWEDARTAACRQGAEAELATLSRFAPAPERFAAEREGWGHGGAQFERTTPRPEFQGSRDATKLMFVSEKEEGSKMAALKGRMRGPERLPVGKEVA